MSVLNISLFLLQVMGLVRELSLPGVSYVALPRLAFSSSLSLVTRIPLSLSYFLGLAWFHFRLILALVAHSLVAHLASLLIFSCFHLHSIQFNSVHLLSTDLLFIVLCLQHPLHLAVKE